MIISFSNNVLHDGVSKEVHFKLSLTLFEIYLVLLRTVKIDKLNLETVRFLSGNATSASASKHFSLFLCYKNFSTLLAKSSETTQLGRSAVSDCKA
jgi:hypothetical protein